MKLQILVPQYKETDAEIKPLLDSIALQQNVNFDDVGVIICNDGSDVFLSHSLLDQYPYQIEYHKEEHRGVSATRNACLDYADAEYVMFCDADDMFMNACGLWIIFREMIEGFDGIVSVFVEETKDPKTMEKIYVNHDNDVTFVHGKIYRREYLLRKNIKFNPDLQIHEDSYFNVLARSCSSNMKYCQVPFYLWRWRDDSVCRHDPKYILKTYKDMLKSSGALTNELQRRHMNDDARFYTLTMVFDAYYTMNKPEWIDQENQDYRDETEKAFSVYFKERKSIWEQATPTEQMLISNTIRTRSVSEGMQMETVTIEEWLRHVETLGDNDEFDSAR